MKRKGLDIEEDDCSTAEEDLSISYDKDDDEIITKTPKNSNKIQNNRTKRVRKAVDDDNEDDNDEVEENSLSSPDDSDDEKNIPPEAGQIIEVEVENFMCHRKFSQTFGRHVNFITGRNGSGKSAIVSAIQLCLGATAKNTGRGNKLDGFIREGSAGPAIARVTVRNDGSDAYKPHIYGSRIVIERKINRSGQSGYTLYKYKDDKKTKNGLVVVSNEKQELEGLLRNYNIYIDNPCCVLTQEEAKKFIQGHEKEKYEFFLKATGLQRTKEEISVTHDLIAKTEEDLNKAKESLVLKEKEKKKLEDDMNIWNTLNEAEQEIKLYRAKFFWSQAYECEYEIKEIGKELKQIESDLNKENSLLEKLEKNRSSFNSLESIGQLTKDITDQMDKVKEEINEKMKLVAEIVKQESSVKLSLNELTRSKKEFSQRLSTVTKEIKDLRNRALQNADGEEKTLLEKIEEISKKIEETQSNEVKAKESKNNLLNEINRVKSEKSDLTNTLRQLDNDIRKLTQDKTSLSSDNVNGRLTLFGQKIPNLLNQISKEKFRGPVIGPIGMHIKIKDGFGETSQAVEAIIGKYNVNKSNNILTVIDVITIENDIIYNVIVDQVKAEHIAIAKDENDAKNKGIITRTNGKDGLPYDIHRVVIHTGSTITYRYGNQLFSTNNYDFRRLLTTNTKEAINAIDEIIQNKTNEKHSVSVRLQELDDIISTINNEGNKNELIIKNSYNNLVNLRNKKKEIDSRLSEIRENQNIDTTPLEEEATELKEGIETVDSQITIKENELKQISMEVKRRKTEKSNCDHEYDNLKNQLEESEKQLSDYISSLETINKQIFQQKKRIDNKQNEYNSTNQKYNEKDLEYENLKRIAIEKTNELIENWDEQPIPIKRNETSKEISKMIKILENDLKNREQEIKTRLKGRSKESVQKCFEKAEKDFIKSSTLLETITLNHTNLQKDYIARTRAWVKKLKSTSSLVNDKFLEYLEKKKMGGQIEFDHKNNLLHIRCQLDNQNDNTTCQDVRQLSGGERSFTTLCLLLALGHVIECPFRLMDEYDVFLDEKVRDLTLKTLQDYALQTHQYNRQFFIITPHSLKNVNVSDKIRIFEMPVPTRNSSTGLQQTTLQF